MESKKTVTRPAFCWWRLRKKEVWTRGKCLNTWRSRAANSCGNVYRIPVNDLKYRPRQKLRFVFTAASLFLLSAIHFVFPCHARAQLSTFDHLQYPGFLADEDVFFARRVRGFRGLRAVSQGNFHLAKNDADGAHACSRGRQRRAARTSGARIRPPGI